MPCSVAPPPARMRVGVRPSSPDQSLTLPELRPTFGRKLLDRERGSARHCGLNLLAHLSLGRSGTPLRGGGVLFRHAASLSGMSQLTACAISTSAMSPDPNNSIGGCAPERVQVQTVRAAAVRP